MSPAYKVEELLALRDSVSESAVSLERFADEDVIKGWWLVISLFTLHSSLFITSMPALKSTISIELLHAAHNTLLTTHSPLLAASPSAIVIFRVMPLY